MPDRSVPSRSRPARWRLFGWLAVLALIAGAIFAPSAAAGEVIDLGDTSGATDQSGLCSGDYMKIESAGVLEAGTHTYSGTTKAGAEFWVTLTVVLDGDGEVESITYVDASHDVDRIVIKGGDGSDAYVHYDAPFSGALTAEFGAISNVAFCVSGDVAGETSAPTDVPATDVPPTDVPPTDVPPTDVPPSGGVSPTDVPPTDVPPTDVPPTDVPPTDVPPSGGVSPTDVPPTDVPPTDVPPTGGVGDVTGTPPAGPTLPPTDLEAQAAPNGDAWRLGLLALAAIVAAALVLTPGPARRRR